MPNCNVTNLKRAADIINIRAFGLYMLLVVAATSAPTDSTQAALVGNRFICSVAPGYGPGPMVLRIRVTTTDLVVNMPTIPPGEGLWKLVDNNAIGIVASTGSASSGIAGHDDFVSGSMFFIRRSTGLIRWTESGADNQAVVDRVGSCIADQPSSQ